VIPREKKRRSSNQKTSEGHATGHTKGNQTNLSKYMVWRQGESGVKKSRQAKLNRGCQRGNRQRHPPSDSLGGGLRRLSKHLEKNYGGRGTTGPKYVSKRHHHSYQQKKNRQRKNNIQQIPIGRHNTRRTRGKRELEGANWGPIWGGGV